MSLLSQNKKDDKKGKKNSVTGLPGAKTNVKAGKTPTIAKKPIKTGGTRGS